MTFTATHSSVLSRLPLFICTALTLGLFLLACSKGQPSAPPPPSSPPTQQTTAPTEASDPSLSKLFNHIWRVTKAPGDVPRGSIHIFLPNGTLLETSCVETYRIARWTAEKNAPGELRIVEDGQLAFTAKITELTNTTLSLSKRLARGQEVQNVAFNAVEGEYVCPDMPK